MNFCKVLLSVLLVMSQVTALADNYGIYYSELKAYKKDPATKEIFDEDAHYGLSAIQRDILIDKELSWFSRFVRAIFLAFDVVIVTPETLPKLYEYVDGICKKANIVTPTIFITRDKHHFFNAAAQKLLMSTGAIIIGQKLMKQCSDVALEGVVAHEIGHIKYNHVNKMLALGIIDWIAYSALLKVLTIDGKVTNSKVAFAWVLSSLVSPAIINKRFEKEADEFACKDNDRSKGLIEFFELILEKEELRKEEFIAVYKLLQENKAKLSFYDYYFDLIIRYYMARFGHNVSQLYKYIYYNTFLGAHPSPEARIEAAKKYLRQEA